MMKSREEIKQKLIELFNNQFLPDVVAILLFGSVAKKETHPESDIDVGVLFFPQTSKALRTRLIYSIYERIPHYFIEPVDVVGLNDADLFLCREILSKGELILCRDLDAWKQFRDVRLLQCIDYQRSIQKYYPQLAP